MGKFLTGEVHGSLTRDANTNKSKPNHDMGLVRQSENEGLEPYFSFDAGKPKDRVSSPNRPSLDGVGAPLVDIPLRHANKSRSKDLWLESTIATITGSKFERIKSSGRNSGKENLDIQNDNRELLRKQDLQKPNPGESLMQRFNLLISSRECPLRILQHAIIIAEGEMHSRKMMSGDGDF